MHNRFRVVFLILVFFLSVACAKQHDVGLDIDPQLLSPYFSESVAVRKTVVKLGQENPDWFKTGGYGDTELETFILVYLYAKAYHIDGFTQDHAEQAIQQHLTNYVEKHGSIKTEMYEALALDGLLSSLDIFSRYESVHLFPKTRYNVGNAHLQLGMIYEFVPEGLKLLSIRHDGAAALSGLRQGDVIRQIGPDILRGMNRTAVLDYLYSFNRKDLKLVVSRGAQENLSVNLSAKGVKAPSLLSHHVNGHQAYIRLLEFNEGIASRFETVLERINSRMDAYNIPPEKRSYVLDLRDNPGGQLEEAILISDMFLSAGEITKLTGRYDDRHFTADSNVSLSEDIAVVVLMNAGSASASEIVVGALSANKRATIIGEKSYGKYHAQTYLEMKKKGMIVLTSETYFLPYGESSKGGIEPDVVVFDDPDRFGDEQLDAAYKMLDEMIKAKAQPTS